MVMVSVCRPGDDDDVLKTPVLTKTRKRETSDLYKEKIRLESQNFRSIAFGRIIEFLS